MFKEKGISLGTFPSIYRWSIILITVKIFKLNLIMKTSKNYVGVSNQEIHKQANLSKECFLKKIECVKELRTDNRFEFTLYPVNMEECEINLKIWDFVNVDTNALNDDDYVFNIDFPKPLYDYLKNIKREHVLNSAILKMAMLYVTDPDNRDILEKQVYQPIFNEAVEISQMYFKEVLGMYDSDSAEYWIKLREAFFRACEKYITYSAMYPFIIPSKILKSREKYVDWNERDLISYSFPLSTAYMRDRDWKSIIENNGRDTLCRVESKKEPYLRWKTDFLAS